MTGYKIRIYPNKAQEQILWKQIYGCRFMWNYMVSLQESRYKNNSKYLSRYDMCKEITNMKTSAEYSWLKEVSIHSLQRVCRNLDDSYHSFFHKKSGRPKFKKRGRAKNSYPVDSENLWFDGEYVHLSKVKKIKYKTDLSIPTGRHIKIFNGVVTLRNDGKWMLSFSMEEEHSTIFNLTDKTMGIDLGVLNTATLAYNNEYFVFNNINKTPKIKNIEKRIKKLSKDINRKYQANKQGNKYIKTNNILKKEKQLRKLYFRLDGIRENYAHQMTHQMISMRPKTIVLEDLNIVGMLKNRHLSKAIQQQNFFKIRRQIEYKSKKYGIDVVFADRYFPSSKLCSSCGFLNKELTLKDRIFICPICGNVLDRDCNAALNLSRYLDK